MLARSKESISLFGLYLECYPIYKDRFDIEMVICELHDDCIGCVFEDKHKRCKIKSFKMIKSKGVLLCI